MEDVIWAIMGCRSLYSVHGLNPYCNGRCSLGQRQ